ncbi:hypothetical protein I4Q36_01585 [Tuanshanicoccus lijuaniae]|uniref:hypothetical protein n=1 Tax=Aerococcaceae bacterium zg-1292 TaxID=2774330 RepID=UPI0019364811|nr:hypothetical protein [Aerococcaceae bacterium zg-1292]QQA37437.1 hypothetical protein I4Q36_01585 [Aerococcaceae bacterium zg-1292]
MDTELTYPLSNTTLVYSKLISLLSIVYLLFLGYITLNFLASLLFFGAGDLSYPLTGYDSDLMTLKVYQLKELLFRGVFLISLLLLCSISLVSALSNYIKNKLHLFFISIVLILSQVLVIPEISILNTLSPFLPFIYLKPVNVLSFSLAHQISNLIANYHFAVFVSIA